eukprot:9125777-Pyramimonas_sp.AAC.1
MSSAPRRTRSEAPPEYQQEEMPTRMAYSKGCDNKNAVICTSGGPQAERQSEACCTGIVRPSQGVNTAETLSRLHIRLPRHGIDRRTRSSEGRL